LNKRYYESYIILDGNLEETTIEESIQKYESFLQKNEVDLKNLDRMGRRRLAYPIKRKQNGYYVCMEIESSPDLIKKLERSFRLDENILRFLTVHLDKKTLQEKNDYLKKRAKIKEQLEAEKTVEAVEETKSAEEKIETETAKNLS
jgi:small subunit ribosomal protein S6